MIKSKLNKKMKDMLYVPFRFENNGSQIIYYSRTEEEL